MPLRLLFWNCSVAPTRGLGSRSVSDTAGVVARAVEEGVDLVALCEVDDAAVSAIHQELGSLPVRALPLAGRVGGSRWDFGIIHTHALRCDDRPAVVGLSHGRTIRAGRRVVVSPTAGEGEFVLYLSHWPSRIYHRAYDLRAEASRSLREALRSDLEAGRPVVVLGDFNEEPFDTPLTILQSSRDPRKVVSGPTTWLFNPSWWLAAPTGPDPWANFGSAAYTAGKTSRRYLLDQALTSAAFLDEETRRAPSVRLVELPFRGGSSTMEHAPLELTLP